MQPWRDEYRVRSYESDASGRLSPGFALRYLQETAWNHAQALGFGLDPRERGPLAWVLSRIRLGMTRYPAWGERLVVETWPLGVDRMLALRDFRLLDESGAECGRASSGWLIIDVAARRPRRPEQALPGLAALGDREPIAGMPGRVEGAAAPCDERGLQVLPSDIDVNGHVNNVRYFEWALDSLPSGRLAGHEVRAVEASFVSEALLGESAAVRSVIGPSESRHTIVELGENREVCRIRLAWGPRSGA
jgi:medium-chain acyl-[acyl-carrier-protein] hydrolase